MSATCTPSSPCGACSFCTADEEPAADPAAELLAGVRNGRWLDEQRFPPINWSVPGVLPEGFTLLVGAPKIGKSWLVGSLALSVAAGGRALGTIPVEQRPVLYLALEDGHRRLQDRCRKITDGEPLPEGFEFITNVMPGQVMATIRAWLERHPDERPLVILDTLGRVMPPALAGETTYMRDYRVGVALKTIADEHGAAIVVVHHDRKATSDDFVDAISGTNGLGGAADTIVVIERRRHDTDATIKVTGRDVAENEYAATLNRGVLWQLAGATLADAAAAAASRRDVDSLSDRSASIVGYARQRSPQAVTPSEIAGRYGISADDAGRYLRRLADNGRLKKDGRGRYVSPPTVSEVSEVSETTNVVVGLFGQTDTSDTTSEVDE